ncbi:MAG: hypothetical protein MZV63_46910 [Marinilabiliales bacterium]|nr:hypothetical protein [Marinilabiliales bacterium]
MVIGSFFSAIGRDLLAKFPLFVENIEDLAPTLAFDGHWKRMISDGRSKRRICFHTRFS